MFIRKLKLCISVPFVETTLTQTLLGCAIKTTEPDMTRLDPLFLPTAPLQASYLSMPATRGGLTH